MKNLINVILTLLFISTAFLGVNAQANTGDNTNENYFEIKHQDSGKDLTFDSEAYGSTQGTNINFWFDAGNSANQDWSYNPVSKEIVHRLSNLCLDVRGGVFQNATKLQLWECNGWIAQKWNFGSDGLIRLDAVSEFCIDGHFLEHGYNLQIWGCHGGENQRYQTVLDFNPSSLSSYYTIQNPSSDLDFIPGTFAYQDSEILSAFNQARAADPSVLPFFKTLTLPPDYYNYTPKDRYMYLLNSERIARGLLPLEKEVPQLASLSQTHSDNMASIETLTHVFNGVGSFGRIDNNADLNACHSTAYPYSESLFYGGVSGFDLPVTKLYENAVYYFIYQDSTVDWGHRKHLLSNYLNNSGSSISEGYFGLEHATIFNSSTNVDKLYLTFKTIDPKVGCSL